MRHRRTALTLGIALTVVADVAEAQIVRRFGGGGIAIRAPFAPPVTIQFSRPILPRARVFGGPVYGPTPLYAAPPAYGGAPLAPIPAVPRPMTVARPLSVDQPNLPSAAELRTMDESGLLNAVVGLMQQLDADLARFDTGSMWQEYLRLPSDALPPPSGNRVRLGMQAIQRTIAQFDAIASNPEYSKISSLPSFAASHAALVEVVRRFGRRPVTPTAPAIPPQSPVADPSEELPPPSPATRAAVTSTPGRPAAPTLAAPINSPVGERSILSR
jgi:hypothetical protein